jgi:hypothetical protein
MKTSHRQFEAVKPHKTFSKTPAKKQQPFSILTCGVRELLIRYLEIKPLRYCHRCEQETKVAVSNKGKETFFRCSECGAFMYQPNAWDIFSARQNLMENKKARHEAAHPIAKKTE